MSCWNCSSRTSSTPTSGRPKYATSAGDCGDWLLAWTAPPPLCKLTLSRSQINTTHGKPWSTETQSTTNEQSRNSHNEPFMSAFKTFTKCTDLLDPASLSWPSPLALWPVCPTTEGRGELPAAGDEAWERWVRTSWE